MDGKRRDFIKGSVAASACIVLLPGTVSAIQGKSTANAMTSSTDLHIQKSIKAGFGGGFSVLAHTQANGLTHAQIEHSGTQYAVTSADLLNWKIVASL